MIKYIHSKAFGKLNDLSVNTVTPVCCNNFDISESPAQTIETKSAVLKTKTSLLSTHVFPVILLHDGWQQGRWFRTRSTNVSVLLPSRLYVLYTIIESFRHVHNS